MAQRRPRLTEEQWLQHKPFIRQHFLTEDRSLKDLITLLQTQGLQVTKAQVEYKLKQWTMSKNIDGAAWKSIGHVITKRKLQGKDSEVIHSGKRLKQSTVDKETERHRDVRFVARFEASPPPLSPASTQIVICTPPSLPMEFEWPDTLPWLKFQDVFRGWTSTSPQKQSLQSTMMRPGEISPLDILASKILPKYEELDTNVHLSKLAARIGMTMPEFHSGEHLQTVQLLANSRRDSIPNCLRLIIYNISNAMVRPNMEDGTWEATHDLLFMTGLLEAADGLKTVRQQSVTVRAFMDNLFRSAINYIIKNGRGQGQGTVVSVKMRRNVDKAQGLAQWLLSLGQTPDVLVPQDIFAAGLDLTTALDKAIKFKQSDVVELLLKAGADTSLTLRSPPHESLVHRAINYEPLDVDARRTIEALVRCKACTALDEAHAAILLEDKDLFKKALQRGADLTSAVQVSKNHLVYQQTALSVAARVNTEAVRQVLGHLKHEHPFTPTATFITPDVFIAAAIAGDADVISYLHDINPIGFMVNEHGITPLQVAVSCGRRIACQRLFQLYSEQTGTALLLCIAIDTGHLEILQDFLECGVDVNATTVPGDKMAWACLEYSLLDDELYLDDDTPKNALEAVLWWPDAEEGIDILIGSGAKFPMDAVHQWQFLSSRLLSKVLDAGGDPNATDRGGKTALQSILTSDLESEHMLDNVKILLESGADLLGAHQEVLQAIVPIHVRITFSDYPMEEEELRQHENLRSLLLEHGAGSMGLDNDAGPDLEAAIFAQSDSLLKEVLTEFPGYYNPGALCAAALVGNHWIIDLLLANRGRQTTKPDLLEGTAVGLAARSGDLHLVQQLALQLRKPGLALTPFYTSDYSHFPSYELKARIEPLFWHEFSMSFAQGSPLGLAASTRDTKGFSELLRMGYNSDRLTWARVVELGAHGCLQALLGYTQRVDDLVPAPLKLRPLLLPAIEKENRDAVISLLKSGVDVNERSCTLKASRSPLQRAVEIGSLEIVDSLLRADPKADINVPPSFMMGVTALQVAAIKGYLGLAKKLLDLGARVNARGARECGRTALEGAAEHGRLDMIQLLVHHGALTTGSGSLQYSRAIYFATRKGHDAAVDLLRRSRGEDGDAESCNQMPARCNNCPSVFSMGQCLVICRDSDGWASFCCDEIHRPEDSCINDYTDGEESWYREVIVRRKFAPDDSGNYWSMT
ncbi:hypothetical protein ACJZ2D_009018 [Fusarium nematophilum]